MTPHRTTGAIALAAAASLSLGACSFFDGGSDSSAAPVESVAPSVDPVTITMSVWGGFGLDDLVTTYEATHPGVTVTLTTGDYNPLHQELQSRIVAGSGAPTIAAIGEDYIAQFAAQPDAFVDLTTLGASNADDAYLPWAWAEASAASGQLALPASVSGLALCYRADLFDAAGLPSDRADVTEYIGDTWDGLIRLGGEYQDATNKHLLDSGAPLLRAVREQDGASYYDASGALALADAEPAFSTALDAIDAGITAGVAPYTDAWNAALANGDFAATLCPSWGMGYIQATLTESGSDAVWDVADIPGNGGSWGGTFYAIPAQATPDQQAAAWDLLSWLAERDQQIALFQATGNLPAQPALYAEGSVQGYTNSFFNDAPVGVLLSTAASELPVQSTYAAKNGTVESTLQQVLDEVQAGNVAAVDAWTVAQQAAALADGATPPSAEPTEAAG